MKARLKAALVWTGLVCALAALAVYAFEVRFLTAALFCGTALAVNGAIAVREDRGRFND